MKVAIAILAILALLVLWRASRSHSAKQAKEKEKKSKRPSARSLAFQRAKEGAYKPTPRRTGEHPATPRPSRDPPLSVVGSDGHRALPSGHPRRTPLPQNVRVIEPPLTIDRSNDPRKGFLMIKIPGKPTIYFDGLEDAPLKIEAARTAGDISPTQAHTLQQAVLDLQARPGKTKRA